MTPCLGRDVERVQLASVLPGARCVSVVGPPGCGKTLLTRTVVADEPQVAWVDAGSCRDVDVLIDRCLAALEGEQAPGDSRQGALARAVDGSGTLLVVDGVGELEGLADTMAWLYEETSDTRCVVTARAPLGLSVEHVVRLGPLPLPRVGSPLQGPALELCLERVAAAGGSPIDLAADGETLRRLLLATGGLPLLIEQLAAQVAVVGVRNAAPTHSMAEALDASVALLDEDRARCFFRLAQLAEPVGLDVLAEIAGLGRDRAASVAADLARRSLVIVEGDGRFGMLAPIRAYAVGLTVGGDDAARVEEGLLRWAERVTPDDPLVGTAGEAWLADLPVMRAAIEAACADPATRARGYALANRVFPALYAAMRHREAGEILEGVLASGDGPPDIGAQVARRAGICVSEARGTYEGLALLDRAQEHAATAPDPALESARNLSIRAEMHLDAADLDRAEADAERAVELGGADSYVVRQARRTLVDVHTARGDFRKAQAVAELVMTGAPPQERWIALSARLLLGRIALEQGRTLEALAAARAAYAEAQDTGEHRIALLADNLARQADPSRRAMPVDRDTLPWAVRLPVLCEDARTLLLSGEAERAAGLAADVVVLADSCRLGRESVGARLVLGGALLDRDEDDQAAATFHAALDHAVRFGLPLRAADALDGLAALGRRRGGQWTAWSRGCAAAARAVRRERYAVPWGVASCSPVEPAGRAVPEGWVADGAVTGTAVREVARTLAESSEPVRVLTDLLTPAELAVAQHVAAGMTSRQIAEALFVSPRTVDAHLAHIYRKLGIASRARLAALMVELR